MSIDQHHVACVVDPRQLTAADIAAWEDLESRAVEPNAYLSPHFLLPALRWLTPHETTYLVIVERRLGATRELIGVAAFAESAAARRFGLRSLIGYRSKHSFLGGMLLDRACAPQALRTLLQHLARTFPSHRLVEIPKTWRDGEVSRASAVADAGPFAPRVLLVHRAPRAILVPRDSAQRLSDKAFSCKLRDSQRRMRRLREAGDVQWRALRGIDVDDAAIERFLCLEHMGWKGREGSSLRSRPNEEAFFTEAARAFAARGRIAFNEILLDGRAIASTCTFISGDAGFGFKIGWDPAYKAASPARLNEIELMRNAAACFGDLRYIDSGSDTGSYINELWPARRDVATLWLSTGPLGSQALRLAEWISMLKHSLKPRQVAGAT